MKRRSFIKMITAIAAFLAGGKAILADKDSKPKVKKSGDGGWHIVTCMLGNTYIEMRIRGNNGEIETIDIDYMTIIQPREQKEL